MISSLARIWSLPQTAARHFDICFLLVALLTVPSALYSTLSFEQALQHGRPFLVMDGIGYFAYLPSLLFDGDLHFANDYAALGLRPERSAYVFEPGQTGYVQNVFPVGTAMLWLPFYLGGHLLALGLEAAQYPFSADGRGHCYQLAVLIGTQVYVLLGLLLTYRLLCRRFDRKVAALAVYGISRATFLLWYTVVHGHFAHGPSLFAAALLLTLCHDLRPTPWRFLTLGLCFGLLAAVRPDASVLAPFPLLALVRETLQTGGPGRARRFLGGAALFAAGCAIAFGPQLAVWYVLQGAPTDARLEGDWFHSLLLAQRPLQLVARAAAGDAGPRGDAAPRSCLRRRGPRQPGGPCLPHRRRCRLVGRMGLRRPPLQRLLAPVRLRAGFRPGVARAPPARRRGPAALAARRPERPERRARTPRRGRQGQDAGLRPARRRARRARPRADRLARDLSGQPDLRVALRPARRALRSDLGQPSGPRLRAPTAVRPARRQTLHRPRLGAVRQGARRARRVLDRGQRGDASDRPAAGRRATILAQQDGHDPLAVSSPCRRAAADASAGLRQWQEPGAVLLAEPLRLHHRTGDLSRASAMDRRRQRDPAHLRRQLGHGRAPGHPAPWRPASPCPRAGPDPCRHATLRLFQETGSAAAGSRRPDRL
jgi:hypothetical protein